MSKKKIVTLDELVIGAEESNKDVLEELKQHFPDTRTTKDLLNDKTLKLSWLVDGLLLEGGSSLVVAEPKTGKSVLARQLAYAIAKGERVLNRDTKQGLVAYISVEDHPAIVKLHMKNMGASGDESIIWIMGGIVGLSFKEGVEFLCQKLRPSLIVVDTMFKTLRTNDINDYNTMIESLQKVTEVVRKYNSHIMYIHHLNKGGAAKKSNLENVFGGGSRASLNRIMGSTGISGEVNNILILHRDGENRFLNTSFSRCGDRIDDELLHWDEKRGIYLINEI